MVQIVIISVTTGSIFVHLIFLFFFIRKRWQQKLERTQRIIEHLNHNDFSSHLNYNYSIGTISKLVIGDISCRYNAQSPYLRCAVNPLGSCNNCGYYEKLEDWGVPSLEAKDDML